MTKTEYEYLKELNNKMPIFTGTDVEIEKKIAMYIYLELGKAKVFDENYFLGNSKEKKKIERLSNHTSNNIDSVINSKKVVCITISNLYKKLLQHYGIKASNHTLYTDDDHVSTIITFCNGEQIVADIQRDLEQIQTRRKTKHWGHKYEAGEIIEDTIDDNELFELQKECGYINSKEDYMDYSIDKLKKRIHSLPPNEVLREIVNNKEINNYSQNIGYIELYKYFSSLINEINPKYNRNGIDYFNCYIERNIEGDKTEKEYCMCLYSIFCNEVEAYLYSNSDKKFKKTDLETFKTLEEQGLHLGRIPQEKGVKLFQRHINNYIKNINNTSKCAEGIELF